MLAFALFLALAQSTLAGDFTIQIGSWSATNSPVDTFYGPDSGNQEMREYIPSTGSSRYIYMKGYNLRYTSTQISHLNGSGGSFGHIVTHAFSTSNCASRLNGTTYTQSNLPGARFELVKEATCSGGLSNPSNEVRILFEKGNTNTTTSYYALVEYKDPYWNGSIWTSQGRGNGDNGKVVMSHYIDQCCLLTDKKDWRTGFYCAYAYTNSPGLNATTTC
jgi:hypothetical protein